MVYFFPNEFGKKLKGTYMNRRQLLTSAGIAAATPLLSHPLISAAPTGANSVPIVSPSLCNNMAASLARIAAKVQAKMATQQDILNAADNINTMNAYFLETGFHSLLQEAAGKADPTAYCASDISDQIDQNMAPYTPGFHMTDLPGTIDAPLSALHNKGMGNVLGGLVNALNKPSHVWPVNYYGVVQHISCEHK